MSNPLNRKSRITHGNQLIRKHGGYRKLKSFQLAQIAFDITVRFCDRYVSKFSRTRDQMIQAANAAPILINVACYLLDKQLATLAKNFENNGGFTERLHRIRSNKRL